jgi:hypothetical protein
MTGLTARASTRRSTSGPESERSIGPTRSKSHLPTAKNLQRENRRVRHNEDLGGDLAPYDCLLVAGWWGTISPATQVFEGGLPRVLPKPPAAAIHPPRVRSRDPREVRPGEIPRPAAYADPPRCIERSAMNWVLGIYLFVAAMMAIVFSMDDNDGGSAL